MLMTQKQTVHRNNTTVIDTETQITELLIEGSISTQLLMWSIFIIHRIELAFIVENK